MITFVSSFYQLKSKFSIETYKQWASKFINETMNFNLVLYSDKNSYPYIEHLVKNNSKVKVILKELEEFNLYILKDKWIENHSKNYLLNHTSWELNMLWNEKVFMVYETMKENPFNTQWFGWCDIGYFRDGNVGTKEFPWPNLDKIKSLHQSRIYYGLVGEDLWVNKIKSCLSSKYENGLPIEPIPAGQVSIAGGFFVTHKQNINWYKELIKQKINLYFENDYLIKDDQIIVADCIFSNLDKFQLIQGDWFVFRDYLMKVPMVSILMPVYNGIEFVEESVSSIQNQSYQDWELIIGINGHTPYSEIYTIAKKYECEKIKVYDLDTKGKPDSLNKMLEYTGGKWVSLLDVDDKWYPSKLEKQIIYMNDYDIIGSKCQYFGDRFDIPEIPSGDLKDFNFLSVNPVINSSCLVRKELCHWIDNFFGIEDYEMWLRLWKENRRFFNLSEVLVLHRIHNKSSFNAKGNDDYVDDLRKIYL